MKTYVYSINLMHSVKFTREEQLITDDRFDIDFALDSQFVRIQEKSSGITALTHCSNVRSMIIGDPALKRARENPTAEKERLKQEEQEEIELLSKRVTPKKSRPEAV